ncbi:FG-GAP-like repeat-containing protein [Novipirellula sp.]|uniref:FG-GAP-like repeat-containing protein n=1 Tax=Novipirellula sp. TaxID=2795430 RepID=UPI003565FF62
MKNDNVFRHTLTTLALTLLTMHTVGCRQSTQSSSDDEIAKRANRQVIENAAADSPSPELKILGTVPPFTLTDQSGRQFSRDQLSGKVWVATFIFTRCGMTCPAQTAAFAELQQKLKSDNAWGVTELVSFTVDPEFDTPHVLTQYGKKSHADFEHWHFLTGDRGVLWDLSKDGFKLPVTSPRDANTLIAHSQMFVLVDGNAQIRGYYSGLSPEANVKLKQDIHTLLDDQSPQWKDRVNEIAVPEDVRDPQWLTDRAEQQKADVAALDITSDFQFRDSREDSGIQFKDEVVDDVKRAFKAAHYDHGSGIATADVDNDGRLDIYFVSQFGRNELWRNQGDGKFENITESAGVGVSDEVSVGASFADIDNDGNVDLYLTRVRAPNKLFRGDGQGHFEDISDTAGVNHVGHSSGSIFFDYDRDGLLDLLLTNVGKYTTEERGNGGYYLAYPAAFTGHLHDDRVEENILFHNLGDGRFENANEQLGFHDASWSGDASAIDANNDGWPDIYLLNMQGHDEYYENEQGKRFVKKSRELFPRTAWGTMGIKVFDFDRDGQLDLYVTDMHTDMVHDLKPDEEKSKMRRNLPIKMLATDGNHILGNAFYRKTGVNQFEELSADIGAENYWPWGISVGDLNADGFEDAFIAASMSYPYRYGINSVLLNDRGQKFVDSEFALGVEPRSKGTAQPWMELDCSGADRGNKHCQGQGGKVLVWAAIGTRSSVIFDLDDDGDLDIVTNDFGGTPMVLKSNLSDQHQLRFLKVHLVGDESNRDGIGAMVEVTLGDRKLLSVHDGKSGYLSQSRMPMYFGLGDSDSIDKIEVTWPSGKQQVVQGPIETNQQITINEKPENDK